MSGGTHPDVQTDMPKLGRYHVQTDVVHQTSQALLPRPIVL